MAEIKCTMHKLVPHSTKIDAGSRDVYCVKAGRTGSLPGADAEFAALTHVHDAVAQAECIMSPRGESLPSHEFMQLSQWGQAGGTQHARAYA